MTTREGEILFLLSVVPLLEQAHGLYDEHTSNEQAEVSDALSTSEREVLTELLLSEKQTHDYAPSPAGCTFSAADIGALLAGCSLATMYAGDTDGPYTHFILSFYSSALYTQLPTRVNTAAVRLFQRFLNTCRGDAWRCLEEGYGRETMEVVLRQCLDLAGNLSSTVQIVAPSGATGVVLGELGYDAHEVSPLDYLDILLPHIPYLSQMCQQAALLLLANPEMVSVPSSHVALFTILFAVRNIAVDGDAVQSAMTTWPAERKALFGRMNAFLNRFT